MPTGIAPWNKGKKISEETKKKIKENNAKFWLGKKRPEVAEWLGKANIGRIVSKETRQKLSDSHKGKSTASWHLKGKNHPRWKGGYKNTLILLKNRRALKKNAEGSHTLGEWELLKIQYGFTCPCCKKKEPEVKLTEDHIIPLSKGGSNFIQNIQPLCHSCNSRKNNKIIPRYE
ncbi:MAG: HNH endonuclease [Candidatus Roizmanbacteria bacterium]